MKMCIKCNQDKREEEFHFKAHSKTERRNICQECRRRYNREHYENHKADYIKRAKIFNKKTRKQNRQKLLVYLSDKKCVDCGNADLRVLEFDHRIDKKENVSTMLCRNSWETILKEIDKCDIRCANCHRIKTVNQFGYYKQI